MSFVVAELIKKKRFGHHHTPEEIAFLIQNYTSGEIPDYQMSAWCMAVCFQGMNDTETAELTRQMKVSGDSFNFSKLPHRVDKHSTGGVGDKTTLLIAPIVAAAGVYNPMIAGRGLGHTGGTLDKLESLKGFRVNLSEDEFQRLVSENYVAIMGQTERICPADRKLYALRDVTATVSSLPLICGSIMSKKLAEDLTGLVLDVKYGNGAFMKSLEEATDLAALLKATGEKNGLKVVACISNMNQPLGRFIGNSLEVQECIDILNGNTFVENGFDYYSDTRDLSLILSGYMIYLAQKCSTPDEGLDIANQMLVSGKAKKAYEEICQRQGCDDPYRLPKAKHKLAVLSEQSGFIEEIYTEKIGLCSLELGAGRHLSTDLIDHSSGVEMSVRRGNSVKKGDVLGYLYSNHPEKLNDAANSFLACFKISPSLTNNFSSEPLVARVLG